MRKHLLLTLLTTLPLLTALGSLNAQAQPHCTLTHYSSDDGLSQNSIMSMVQDHNGILWLSTWDGLNRFDGYDFHVYKAWQDNQVAMTNNRVDQLAVDTYNYIWLQTYDSRVFRFCQATERFEQVPAEGEEEGMRFAAIKTLPDGVVWLLAEGEGAVRVTTSPDDHSVSTRVYAHGSHAAHVSEVFADPKGSEWLVTDNGLLRIDGATGEPHSFFASTPTDDTEAVQAFHSWCDTGDALYFGSDRGRIWRYHQGSETFQLVQLPLSDKVVALSHLPDVGLLATTSRQGLALRRQGSDSWEVYDRSRCPEFPDDPFCSAYVDRMGEVWFEMTQWGEVCHFNPHTGMLRRMQMRVEPRGADRSYPHFHICEDIHGQLWVHPQGGGLSWYDRERGELVPFYNDPLRPDWRFSNKLHSMLTDRQGNLWFCTHSKGLEKVTFPRSQFSVYSRTGYGHDLNANTVRALFEDSDGRLWVGKRDGHIEVYSPQLQYEGFLTAEGTISPNGKPLEGVAYHIMQDSRGDLWIATKGEGIIHAEPTSPNHFRLTRFTADDDDMYSLSHNSVYWLHEDHHGRIWVATFGGGLNYIERDSTGRHLFINHRNRLKGFPYDRCFRVRHITSDHQGHIWVGTADGALRFNEDFSEPESLRFHLYARSPSDPRSLSHNNVYRILTTRRGEVYLATFGGGLNHVDTLRADGTAAFRAYTRRDGLPSDVLLSVEEDHSGSLWVSTESGLSKFHPATGTTESYGANDFPSSLRFEESASLCCRDSLLLFGTTAGVLHFRPDSICKSAYVPPIVFTGLRIGGREVIPGVKGSQLQQSLNSIDRLELRHDENFVTLSFAALDFTYPDDVRYAYRLEGLDPDWNEVGHQRTATYTNLPRGEYVLRVRSTNADGVWTDNVRTLPITVLPSFWQTPLAFALYALAFLGVLVAGVYILFTIWRLKHEVTVEQQITDLKLRFFTNISHELRTPLTLIAAPVENVLQHPQLPADARDQLRIVARNTQRMLHLVNEILDFRKIQKQKMRLRVEHVDVVPFACHLMEHFQSLADDHRIDFVLESEQPSLYLWIDTDKLEKMLFNLLSNAFKYTPPRKMITLFIHDNGHSVAIGVADQGIGIPESKRSSLFVRFESLLAPDLFRQQSTGIGLSLVKELADLHQATIRVDSREGEGSRFTLEFQKGKSHYPPDTEFILTDSPVAEAPSSPTPSDASAPASQSSASPEGPSPHAPTLLLVEDNVELRTFLRGIFTPQFRVVEATQGQEGLDKAICLVPDIIISDVMMPVMDGLTLTTQLRTHLATSHIPIVLLTAKADLDSRLQGMKEGADDYITKPFSATYLRARVDNLLVQRAKLQQRYCASLTAVQPESATPPADTQPGLSAADRHFMERLSALMEQHLDNGDLLVDDLVRELAVSRSVFFKKLKSLTGLAPIEYIKEIRVTRAARLIESGDHSMSQVAYMVGINDPRYFSKCFKQRFGMTPTEYKAKVTAARQS